MLRTQIGGHEHEHAEVDRCKLDKRHPAATSLVRPWETRGVVLMNTRIGHENIPYIVRFVLAAAVWLVL